jgi:hypothetical protein
MTKETKKGLSDDMVDGITALVIILTLTAGVVYWLATMPGL